MKKVTFPAIIISAIISLPATLGAIFGYYLGEHFTKKMFEGKTKLKPLLVEIKNFRLHFHHWFLSLLTIISVVLSGYYKLVPLSIYGFLGGILIEDIYWDRKLYKKHIYWSEKWYKIISRVRKEDYD